MLFRSTDYLLFNSRYDRYLDGTETLSAAELRGLQIFNDPARGQCAKCHPSQPLADGSRPLFTTFGYEALGVPRNPDVLANADPGDWLNAAQEALHADLGTDHYVTLHLAVLDLARRQLVYASAGHPAAFILRPEDRKSTRLNSSHT